MEDKDNTIKSFLWEGDLSHELITESRCLALMNFMHFTQSHLSGLSRLLWMHPFPVLWEHHTAWCQIKTCWGGTQSHSPCWQQIRKKASFPTLVPEECHLSLISTGVSGLLVTTVWVWISSLFLIYEVVWPSSQCLSSLEAKKSFRTYSNTLHNSRQTMLVTLPRFITSVITSEKATEFVRHNCPSL